MRALLNIIKKHKYKIFVTTFILVLENILFLILPLLIGYAIDGVIAKNFFPLWTMIFFYAMGLIMSTIRRMIDTRTYSHIHLDMAEAIMYDDEYDEDERHKQLSRVEMTADIIVTLNNEIPMFVQASIQIIGTFIILSRFSFSYFIAMTLVCVLAVIICAFSTKNIYHLNRKLNNNYEGYIDSITKNKNKSFSKYFHLMNERKIHLSDLEARIYGALLLSVLGLLVFVLVSESTKPNVSAGDIFSVMSYVLKFQADISFLPYLYQKIIGTKEIVNRIDED